MDKALDKLFKGKDNYIQKEIEELPFMQLETEVAEDIESVEE